MAKKATMTPNARRIFDFLKQAGVGVKFTNKDVQEALNLEKVGSVTGTVNNLVKKEFAVREKDIREVDGKQKEVSVFYLTEKGAAFDPDEEVAE